MTSYRFPAEPVSFLNSTTSHASAMCGVMAALGHPVATTARLMRMLLARRPDMRRLQLVALLIITLTPSLAAAQGPQRDGNVYRWTGTQWEQVDGSGRRIAVGPNGSPWVVNSLNQIYRRENGVFQRLPGEATDIAVGGDGSVWVIGTDARAYQWAGNDWRA